QKSRSRILRPYRCFLKERFGSCSSFVPLASRNFALPSPSFDSSSRMMNNNVVGKGIVHFRDVSSGQRQSLRRFTKLTCSLILLSGRCSFPNFSLLYPSSRQWNQPCCC